MNECDAAGTLLLNFTSHPDGETAARNSHLGDDARVDAKIPLEKVKVRTTHRYVSSS